MPLPQTPVYRHLRPGQMTGLQPGKDGFPPGFAPWRVPGPGLSLLICKVGEALPALNENGQAHSGSPNGLSGKKKKKKLGTQDAIMSEWTHGVWAVLQGAQKTAGHARLGVHQAMLLTRGRRRFRGFSRRKAED